MSATIIYNISLDEKFKGLISDDVRLFAHSTLYNHMIPYTPMREGVLGDSVRITKDGICYLSPQARYLYYGLLMVSPTTGSAWAEKDERKILATPEKALSYYNGRVPLATSHWGQAAMAAKGDIIAEEIKAYIIKRSNQNG